jgi:hypothetical protein
MEEWRAKEWQLTQQTHSILGAALDSSFGAIPVIEEADGRLSR